MDAPTPELLFWPGSLGSRGYGELLAAAAAGGFGRLALSPLTIADLLASGLTAADILASARADGVTLSALDGVSSWAPQARQAPLSSGLRARFAFSVEQCLEMASTLGLESILAAGVFDAGAFPLEVMVDSFGHFCDAAATRGLRVELEFVPIWGIADLTAAWEIVRGAERPNAGLLVDTWHLHKGTADLERDLSLLESIPAEQLGSVQLADARLQPETESLYTENRLRRFPGDGELAIDAITGVIAAKGGLRRIGTEIFGPSIDDLSTGEAGRLSGDRTRAVVQRALKHTG